MVQGSDQFGFQREIDALRAEITARYGVTGTLAAQVRKLGRALPKYERGQARVLVEAERALGHPKMAMRIHRPAFDHAKTALEMHLERVDPHDRRKGMALSIVATVLVNVALAVAVLWGLWVLLR
ncbi:MAG: hypothetical protein AAFO93_15550 [Pseudomonadota bacterium]